MRWRIAATRARLAWLERQADLAEAIIATRQAARPPGQPKAGRQ
jgi:hypothetical protein